MAKRRRKGRRTVTAQMRRFGRAGKAAFEQCRCEPKSSRRSCMRGVFDQVYNRSR